jgi:hypothetical protein
MNIIYPENEIEPDNRRLSERRNAVKSYNKVHVKEVKLCSDCFTASNIKSCKHCKKYFCSECLIKNTCSECSDKISIFSCCFKK